MNFKLSISKQLFNSKATLLKEFIHYESKQYSI